MGGVCDWPCLRGGHYLHSGRIFQAKPMMDKDQIRDVAIEVTDYLLDNMPTLLDEDVLEVDGEYTEGTWMLQDTITEVLTLIFKRNV